MVFKTFIAATCAAALAGTMVYFSSSPPASSGSVDLEPQQIVAAPTDTADEKKAKSSLMGRYIGQKDKDSDAKATDLTEPAEPRIEDVKSSGDNGRIDGAEPAQRSPHIRENTSNKSDPSQQRVQAAFDQAQNIDQIELRDRAYLSLADYATQKGLFKDAVQAAETIDQVELRDTARSRIAMGMARNGLSDDAFALIDEVEVDELRDVMRLQVIESLLGTDVRR